MKRLLSSLFLSSATLSFANPQGFHPVSGLATCSHPDSTTLEVTASDQSVIEWDSFSIGTNEKTIFVMPNTLATVINKVTGGNMSQILGSIESNGQVYLINPKGVLVGDGAMVNTASFIAASYDIFSDLASSGSVINLGSIKTTTGDVQLLGAQVTNSGTITALSSAQRDGRILLIANEGIVTNTGTLTASGGEVQLLGDKVYLDTNGVIDVSSAGPAGSVILGGTKDNLGSIVGVDATALINANCTVSGDGGTVSLLSTEGTLFLGTITANAGPDYGNGGYVEISSEGELVAEGKVTTYARQGAQGTLLLDPVHVTISNQPDKHYTGTMILAFNPLKQGANINTGSLATFLLSNNVTVDASASGGAPFASITVVDDITWTSSNVLTLQAIGPKGGPISVNGNINGGGNLIMHGKSVILSNTQINAGVSVDIISESDLTMQNASINATSMMDISFTVHGNLNMISSNMNNQGFGDLTGSVEGIALLFGSTGFPSFIQSDAVSLTLSKDLSLIDSFIIGSNTTDIGVLGNLRLTGEMGSSTFIASDQGSLTVNASSIDLSMAALNVNTMSSNLAVNTTGNIQLYNGGKIQNSGTGNVSISCLGTLFVEGGADAGSFIESNTETVVSAKFVSMTGIKSNLAQIITNMGSCVVNATGNSASSIYLNGWSEIVSNGTLDVTADENLHIGQNSTITNTGPSTTTVTANGNLSLLGPLAFIRGGSGGTNINGFDILFGIGSRVRADSGALTITGAQSITLAPNQMPQFTISLLGGSGDLTINLTNPDGYYLKGCGSAVENFGTGMTFQPASYDCCN